MENKLSESKIVRTLGESICQHISRKVIRNLQGLTDGNGLLSGEDSGLESTWDEICAQLQGEESFYWDTYVGMIEQYTKYNVGELAEYEREAAWLLTPEGEDWDCELEEERESYPVFSDDLVRHIAGYVMNKGSDWSNYRIRAYLDRHY